MKKDRVKLETYKEILEIFNGAFMDASAIEKMKMNYVKTQLESKIKKLEEKDEQNRNY